MQPFHTIPAKDISIPPGRNRQEFDEKDLSDLAASITRSGLIHPITVRTLASGGYEVTAGERRLRAIMNLAISGKSISCQGHDVLFSHVPCFIREKLTDLEALEIEYAENADRKDLTWQESAKAEERLHNLRKQVNPSQTITQTASEIYGKAVAGSTVAAVSRDLVLAKHLDDPDVAKAKSADEAMKVVRRKAEIEHRAKLAKTFDLSKTPHTLYHADFFEKVVQLPDAAYDCICTDPPFGVGADSFGTQAAARHDYEDSPEYFKKILEAFCEQSTRITKPASHLYMFCDLSRFSDCNLYLTLAGWTVWHRPLIWDKGSGMLPSPDYGPRQHYECILYAYRGQRKVVLQAQPDVIHIPAVAKPRRGAEKPMGIYRDLLARSCRPGDSVVDLFCGTGPVFPAATALKLIATGIEREADAYAIAASRLVGEERIDMAPDIIL